MRSNVANKNNNSPVIIQICR